MLVGSQLWINFVGKFSVYTRCVFYCVVIIKVNIPMLDSACLFCVHCDIMVD